LRGWEQADGVQAEIGENLRAQAAFMLGLLLAVEPFVGVALKLRWACLDNYLSELWCWESTL
jgi:hypothetical protein